MTLHDLPNLPLENVMSWDVVIPFEMYSVCRRFREVAKTAITSFDNNIVDDIRFCRLCKRKRDISEGDVDYDIFEIVQTRWFRTCMWIWDHIDQPKFIKDDKKSAYKMVYYVLRTHDIRFIKWWWFCGGKNNRNMISVDQVRSVLMCDRVKRVDISDEIQFYFDKKIFPEKQLNEFIHNCLYYEHYQSFETCLKHLVLLDKRKKKNTSRGEDAVVREVIFDNLRGGHSSVIFDFLISRLKTPLTPDEIRYNNAEMWFLVIGAGRVESLELLDGILKRADRSLTCEEIRDNKLLWKYITGVVIAENRTMFQHINSIVHFDLDEMDDEINEINSMLKREDHVSIDFVDYVYRLVG